MDARLITTKSGQRLAVDACDAPCPIEQGMRVIGGKWTGSILWHLKDDPVRFNDLSRLVSGASKKMITERLRHLQRHGLITRTVRETSPISVEYQATEAGQTAIKLLNQIRVWSEDLPLASDAQKETN
ncbi:MAG: helix-turn-helix domain-containing protein [Pseudomonadota bacterium]